MTLTATRLADLVGAEVSWLEVRTADRVPGPDWIHCATLLAEQAAGADPTGDWRRRVAADYGREYAVEPPVQVAAMFVLMWCVSIPSLVAGLSVALTGVSPDVSPRALAFRRHPTAHYPVEVALLSPEVVPAPEAARQVADHTGAFVRSYRPGVKLGSLQRRGAVEDELRAAIRLRADAPYAGLAAEVFGVDPGRTLRTSCCFFYALPNVQACGGCPRLPSAR